MRGIPTKRQRTEVPYGAALRSSISGIRCGSWSVKMRARASWLRDYGVVTTGSESRVEEVGEPQGVITGGEFLAALFGVTLTLASLFFSFVCAWQRGWLWWSLGIMLALAPGVLGLVGIVWSRRHSSKRSAHLLRATGRGLAVTWGAMLALVLVLVTYNITWGEQLH
jgi:hypothetical protein